MPVRVVDASALGALIFGEPKAEEIARTLAGSTLVAPALLWFEMASVALKKIQAHPTQESQIRKAFSLAHSLAIEIIKVDHSAVIELAKKPISPHTMPAIYGLCFTSRESWLPWIKSCAGWPAGRFPNIPDRPKLEFVASQPSQNVPDIPGHYQGTKYPESRIYHNNLLNPTTLPPIIIRSKSRR